MLPITGTFLDEITHDIPSQNWGRDEWRREFALYSRIGLDTVIIIRAGYKNKCIFPAQSIPGLLPVYDDVGAVFFELADEYGLKVFFGTYDSGFHWLKMDARAEIEINKRFLDEAWARYGHHSSFAGWYLTHETGKHSAHIVEIMQQIGGHCRSLSDLPVLISPYPQGAKQMGEDALTLAESFKHWDRVFSEASKVVNICAFQDGQLHYDQLPEFSAGIAELGAKYDITIWSNIESFDRDMPIKFPPADWRYLRFKMETASRKSEKLITFEFPHFMSPYSCYPSAHHLFRRYVEHFEINV